jgi:hypothetical protein
MVLVERIKVWKAKARTRGRKENPRVILFLRRKPRPRREEYSPPRRKRERA